MMTNNVTMGYFYGGKGGDDMGECVLKKKVWRRVLGKIVSNFREGEIV
jgi:hypothetical protein